MASVTVYNMNGESVGELELNDAVFGVEVNEHIINLAIVQYLANKRLGTKSAKTRAEVAGGGKKPWRQKKTGRARHGSIRSPIWRGGGVVFAPKPRDFSKKMNKKEKRLAIKSALTVKAQESNIIVLDALELAEIKTKEMQKVLNNIKAADKALIMIEESNKNIQLSARNIPNVRTASVNTINVYDLIKYDSLVITKSAVSKLEEVYA